VAALSGNGWLRGPIAFHGADNTALETFMAELQDNLLPPTFNRLAWSNLAAQSAEQIALAAAPIVAVLMLGVGEGQTGRSPRACWPTASRGAG